MSKTYEHPSTGRLCNQIIRNLCLSLLSEKYNLKAEYCNFDNINNKLGIKLYTDGTNVYNKTLKVCEKNFIILYNNSNTIDFNLNLNLHFFQNKEITNILHNHLKNNKNNIIKKNPYKQRYNKNNDIFIHIRLTDAEYFIPDINYFIKCINLLKYDNIYIGSDNLNSEFIKKLINLYPKIILIDKSPVETIQFGSTCKNIILSHGSFSAIIGYLGFFSNIYYLDKTPGWCPIDMFKEKGFNSINL
jgi:hypothetical protein